MGAWVEESIESGLVEAGEFGGDFTDGPIGLVSDLRDVRRFIITDHGSEGGAHGKAALDVRLAFLDVRLQPGMPAELFITTADRTLLEYLAKPFGVFAGRAMREP